MSKVIVQTSPLERENQLLRQQNAYLKEELAQLKRMIFGKKNERFILSDASQAILPFDDSLVVEPHAETTQETISYTREKKKDKKQPVRLILPAHLPREEEVLEPADKAADAVKIGEAITEILEYTPGKVFVKRYVRPKYKQQVNADGISKEVIINASLPSLPIPGGNAGPGLLAHLLISKYVDHLPFYRQVQIFKREGLKIPESTISGWFKTVCKLLEPLYEELKTQVLDSEYLMADETPIPVQSSDKPGATHTGYMWVYRSPVKQLVVFDYQSTRGAIGPEAFLKNYKGALQTDGYAAYERFGKQEGITLLACMAHARRKFEQALENDTKKANYALLMIQRLYEIERQCKEENLPVDSIRGVRQQKSIPILNEMKTWMENQYPNVAPQSSIGKAIAYALKLWPKLVRYADNGLWNIDNNPVENSIRPVALGRKNYLFAGSHDAAGWAAMMYAFMAICRAHEVEPFQWLKSTLEKISETKLSQLNTLLPNFSQNL